MMKQPETARFSNSSFERLLGIGATISFPALWASGIFGAALSWQVTLALTSTLMVFCWMVPSERLSSTIKIMLCISSTIFTLCVGDGALRLFAGHLVYYRAHSELLRRDTHYPGLSHYLPNRRSERVTFGDLAAMSGDPSHRVHRHEVFQTDERGFRNAIANHQLPFDLIILGDSFGMGLSSTQDQTWSSILEEQGFSPYNLSMPGTCPAHGALRLARELPTLSLASRATVVVPVYVGNDLDECSEDVERILGAPPATGLSSLWIALEDYRSRSPLRQFAMRGVYRWVFADPVITARALGNGRSMLFYKPHAHATELRVTEVERDPHFAVITRALLQISTMAEQHGASMVVLIIPPKEEVYDWILRGEALQPDQHKTSGIAEALTSFCVRSNLRCIDLSSQFTAEGRAAFERGELLWWTDDSHWNNEGHKVAAHLISEALKPQ